MISSKIALLLMLVNLSTYSLVNTSKFNPYMCSTDYAAVFVVRSRKTGEIFTTYYHSKNKLQIKTEHEKRVTEDRYLWNVFCRPCDSYIFFLASDKYYNWEREGGCDRNIAPILAADFRYFGEVINGLNGRPFTYDNQTKMITVCGNKCLYVEEATSIVKSMPDCSHKEDRLFDIFKVVKIDQNVKSKLLF
uniref:Uncharacterized protein LOC114330713 n=1 Tax=Diabrotica virgifera virgifera TaxID=50390 RepID=A0A6P7FSZ4_DIAVI